MEECGEGNNLVTSINFLERKNIRQEGVVRKAEEENNKSKKSKIHEENTLSTPTPTHNTVTQ